MMIMSFFGRVFAVAVLLTLMRMSAASAALVLTPGTAGSIPQGAPNDVLGPLFGLPSIDGVYGATVSQTGTGQLTIDFLGFEAGFHNIYTFAPGGFFDTDDYSSNTVVATSLSSPLDSFNTSGVGGVLAFTFTTDALAGSVSNATNLDNSAGDVGLPNFFVSQLSPKQIILWLDDSGAGPDRDYDDMVIRITETPLPLSFPLYVTGLGIMGLLAWLKKRRA
jgi:hypothetical protein